MKGLIGKVVPALLLVLGVGGGCAHYPNKVDPCYPERYWDSSRNLVNEAFAPQVNNGHILDQTVWNEHFETGSDTLNAAGLKHLAYLARRRPQADPVIFLQTAQDIPYQQAAPQLLTANRSDLDNRRKVAIEGFLTAQCQGRTNFTVVVHDPAEVGLPGLPANLAIQQMYTTRFQGGLGGGGGGAVPVVGGAGGGGR